MGTKELIRLLEEPFTSSPHGVLHEPSPPAFSLRVLPNRSPDVHVVRSRCSPDSDVARRLPSRGGTSWSHGVDRRPWLFLRITHFTAVVSMDAHSALSVIDVELVRISETACTSIHGMSWARVAFAIYVPSEARFQRFRNFLFVRHRLTSGLWLQDAYSSKVQGFSVLS